MRVKIFLIVTILSACLVGCSNGTVFKDQNDGIAKNIPTIEPSMEMILFQVIHLNLL